MATSATYTLEGAAITCHVCGHTSHNPNDVEQKFCGCCNAYHESIARAVRDVEAVGSSIFVREIIDGEAGTFALSELPPDLARKHALRFAVKTLKRRTPR